MTKNRKAKQAARTLAERAEVNYTEARRREDPGHPTAGTGAGTAGGLSVQAAIKGILSLQAMVAAAPDSDASWLRDEPTIAGRVRTDLDWADVVLDGRRGYDIASDAAPARFAYDLRPADARGRFEIAAGPAASESGLGLRVVVEGYAMGADAHGPLTYPAGGPGAVMDFSDAPDIEANLNGKPGVIVRVTYPDGLRVGYLSYHFGDYNASAQEVWQAYADRPLDGFGWALSIGQQVKRVHSYDEDLANADHQRAVRVGATRLRAALEDPQHWFAGKAPTAPEPGGNAIGDLWWLATSGFVTRDDATPFLDRWHEWDFLPAQDGGFDLADPDDRAWLVAAGAGEWSYDHEDGWAGVARMRAQGWTRKALTTLHTRLRAQQRARYDEVDEVAEFTGMHYTEEFEAAVDAARLGWDDSEASAWVRLAGSPAEASKRIEAGETLQ